MKTISIKLDNKVFDETVEITSKLKLAQNRYINDAIYFYNLLNKRILLKKQYEIESARIAGNSMSILYEFEKITIGN